jgi:alkyldihydroxyacetonephosphate synthase
MVDTLETATVWSNLESLYRSVKETLVQELGALGGEPIVMCHISHLYPGGASLYFTWIGRQPGSDAQEQIANWHRVKHAAGNAINSNGGTITHHHAIGVDHAEWLGLEVGQSGVDLLRAVKSQLDPAGVMNPGKLI